MDTAHFKELLTSEKVRLEGELATIGRRNPAVPNDWEAVPSDTGREADPNDQADLIEGYSENVAILADLEARYDHVLAALARIEDGTYGTCSIGGETIEPERLAADPAATTCMAHLNS